MAFPKYFCFFILPKHLTFFYISFYSISCESIFPDITLLVRKNDFICVIGNNEVDKAAVFISPETISLSTDSKFRSADGAQITENYNCDFENEDKCLQKYNDKNWEIVDTQTNLLPIVHDIRFESLPTAVTKNSTLYVDMREQNFNFPFSVRADDEPQIILCTDSKNIFVHCYWIRIEKNEKNIYEIAIRYCSQVHKEYFSIRDSACVSALPKNQKYPQLQNNLNYLNWFHFNAIRNETKLIFKDGLTKEDYLILNNVTLDIKKIYLRTSDNYKAEWKMHKNSHLNLKTFNTEVQLGTIFRKNIETKFCISMIVHICKSCTFEIGINMEEKQIYYSSEPVWQNIKLTSEKNFTEAKIFIKGLKNNTSGIIAVDNIRLCHDKEIRVLRTKVSNIYKTPMIFCKILSRSTWHTSLSTPNNEVQICDNPKYIGKYCDLPCSAIFGEGPESEFCNKNIICKPSEIIDSQECACASGYTGLNCEEVCSPNFFGYNCQEKCGQCKNNQTCLKSSGICPQGCKEGFVTEKCTYKKYEPINLSCESNANGLINITWSHPKTPELVTLYRILTEKLYSEILNNFTKIEKSVQFPHPRKQFTYVLEKPVFYSSSYAADVCGNGMNDQCAKCNFTTPPDKPKLQEDFIIVDEIVNDTKVIIIPGIILSTKNKNSFLYVTVCNRTSENENMKKRIFIGDEIILSQISCSGTSWIAGKLPANESEVRFTVGAGKNSSYIYANPPLQNIYYDKYDVCVVVTNEYKNQLSFNVYCEFDDGYDYFTNLVFGIAALGIVLLGIITFLIVCGINTIRLRNSQHEEENIPESAPMNRETPEVRSIPTDREELDLRLASMNQENLQVGQTSVTRQDSRIGSNPLNREDLEMRNTSLPLTTNL